MDASSLKTFPIRLGWALSSLVCLEMVLDCVVFTGLFQHKLVHDSMFVQKEFRANPNPNGP